MQAVYSLASRDHNSILAGLLPEVAIKFRVSEPILCKPFCPQGNAVESLATTQRQKLKENVCNVLCGPLHKIGDCFANAMYTLISPGDLLRRPGVPNSVVGFFP